MAAQKGIPEKINLGQHRDTVMSFLWVNRKEHDELAGSGRHLLSEHSDRFVCGFSIPSFQRPLVWTREQEIAFIESAWLGLPIGTFTYHQMKWGSDGKPLRFSGMLIDGQQRLTTLDRYWNDEFTVFGLLWSEVDQVQKRRFMQTPFPHYEVALWDEDAIRELYDRMAFGGTAHEDHQRAVQP